MRPAISLDTEQLVRNAEAWQRHLDVPLRPVVKCDGYGWGYEAMMTPLEHLADAFCVSDADEFDDVRPLTKRPIVVLSAVPPSRLEHVLANHGLPTVDTVDDLRIARDWAAKTGRRLRIRVGLAPAAAWSGVPATDLPGYARELAAADAAVEYWTHVTDLDALDEQLHAFEEGRRILEAAGVRVIQTDMASTYSAVAAGSRGGSARIGIGLFGAGSEHVPGVACALRVEAPIVKSATYPAGTRVGYGGTMLAMPEAIATARGGYGDGLPKTLAGSDDIITMGMQFLTARVDRVRVSEGRIVLLDRTSHIDRFAARCGRLAHEVVTAFGNSARANGRR